MEYLVAPYEADAQMAYLAINGDVHAVITEDSDLLVYGCPRVRDTIPQACMSILVSDLSLRVSVMYSCLIPPLRCFTSWISTAMEKRS